MPAGPGPDGTCGNPPVSCFTVGNIAWHNANVAEIQSERDDIQTALTAKDGELTAAKAARDYAVNNQCPM